ncbi:hypothetical protein [Streptomyces sp. NPDC006971]|uniref:hypothetical protein n=1 Tax=Streptomyces sp. NPDC006971 TaxID=3154784 RepID=UPI0033DF133F
MPRSVVSVLARAPAVRRSGIPNRAYKQGDSVHAENVVAFFVVDESQGGNRSTGAPPEDRNAVCKTPANINFLRPRSPLVDPTPR